jgi:hypothetical protein
MKKLISLISQGKDTMNFCDVIDEIKNELDLADEHQDYCEKNILNELEIKIALYIDIMLELIFDRNISKTLYDVIVKTDNRQTPFYDNGKFLCLPVSVIERIIEASGIEISLSFLSDTLTKMGYKSEGSTQYKTTNGDIAKECWEFLRKWEVERC